MIKSRKKRLRERKERKAFSFLLTFSFLILAGILVFSNIKIKREIRELRRRKKGLALKLERLREEKKDLQKGLSENEGSLYWERKVRQQGYKKEGEEVVVVKRPEEEKIVSREKEKAESFWERFLREVRSVFRRR